MSMTSDQRAALFDRARELSAEQARRSEADAVWVAVIDAYQAAVGGAARPDPEDQRQLARAQWRRAMVLSALGRPRDGMPVGRAAVTLFEQLDAAAAQTGSAVTAAPRDAALAELITALVDLGEIAFAAGDAAERIALVEQALGAGLRVVQPPDAGPRTQSAMATGYHNYATALLHRAVTAGGDARDGQEAALAGSRALQLRQGLANPREPLTMWELCNTYAVYAHCLALIGDLDRAAMVIRSGSELAGMLGPAGAGLTAKLRAAAEIVQAGRRPPGWRPR